MNLVVFVVRCVIKSCRLLRKYRAGFYLVRVWGIFYEERRAKGRVYLVRVLYR